MLILASRMEVDVPNRQHRITRALLHDNNHINMPLDMVSEPAQSLPAEECGEPAGSFPRYACFDET